VSARAFPLGGEDDGALTPFSPGKRRGWRYLLAIERTSLPADTVTSADVRKRWRFVAACRAGHCRLAFDARAG
ncbi:hypothetical protein, partial [Proteus mirabilis]|uniref:hypothetical protein n=1 Tax=Proteus mirabilis TaxID=584 RepID=UPI0013D2A1D1